MIRLRPSWSRSADKENMASLVEEEVSHRGGL
jgi:hypothetical protein